MAPALSKIGGYSLVRELGRGGMGQVFLAVRAGAAPGASLAEHTFALKRLLPELHRNSDARDLWGDELRLAALLRHENLARLVEVGHEAKAPYLVMEYVNGMSVRALVDRHRAMRSRMPPRAAVLIAAHVADALAYASAVPNPKTGKPLELIHRDVSPRNILVSTQGEVKLIDFGVAKSGMQEHRSVLGRPKGKRRYMSPEQAVERPLDGRSDQFSLAVVLVEMLTSVHPFEADDVPATARAIRSAAPALPGAIDARLAALDEVLARALAKRPDDRFPDSGAFAEALRVCSSSLPASAVKLDRLVGGLLDDETAERTNSLARAAGRWSKATDSDDLALIVAEELTVGAEAGSRRRDESSRHR